MVFCGMDDRAKNDLIAEVLSNTPARAALAEAMVSPLREAADMERELSKGCVVIEEEWDCE